jgi:hypothetical protein
MLHFVFPAIYLQVNQLENKDKTHLLLENLIVGRKLMTRNNVFFFYSYRKMFKFSL